MRSASTRRADVRGAVALALMLAGCSRAAAKRDGAVAEAAPREHAATDSPVQFAETAEAAPREPPPSQSPDSTPRERPDWEQADLDPDNDLVVAPPAPLADCAERLKRAGVEFTLTSFPLRQKRGNVFTCGTEQAVVYRRGSEALRWSSRPHVTCRMALALGRFEQIAQEEASRLLGRKIRRVTQAGTYSCRKMQRFADMVSEHSYANAIDIRSFELEGGKTISVLAHFGALESEPTRPEAMFLRSVARRLYDEDVFSVVLTPFFDALHRDHLHLDLARYRLDGTR